MDGGVSIFLGIHVASYIKLFDVENMKNMESAYNKIQLDMPPAGLIYLYFGQLNIKQEVKRSLMVVRY